MITGEIFLVEDGRSDFYVGDPKGAHIKISQEFLEKYKVDYEKLCAEPIKELSIFFLTLSMMLANKEIEGEVNETDS